MRFQLPAKLFQRTSHHALEIALAAGILLLYMPLLIHWYDGWLNKSISIEHEYFSHGIIGLPFAAYLVWLERDRWHRLPNQAHILGIMLLGIGIYFYLSPVSEIINLSFPIVLIGLCLWLKGLPGLRLQAFPLLLVFLATPTEVPYLIAPYTLPIQRLIAGVAGFILFQFGLNVRVEQAYLFVNDRIVEVAPYCAGLKMLFTALYVGLMLLYWAGERTSRSKVISFFMGIMAISIGANILRNTLLALFHGTGQEWAFHWLHEGWGGDLYSTLMLGSIILLLKVIEKWFPTFAEVESGG